ncbi:MAG: carbohydrate ABC transporter permease [Oscillospiraceae bacterium]
MMKNSTKIPMLRRYKFNFYDVFVVAFCGLFALICFYPLWYVAVASVTPFEVFIRNKIMLFPTTFDFQYYKAIFNTPVFGRSLWISISTTVMSTVLTLFVTSTMAYAVSKTQIKGMKFINSLVVFNLFFTGGLIPEYMLYKDIGLLKSYWVMVIPGCLNIIYYIVMRNYFSFSVPTELEEAGKIDGCTDIGVFFRLILPLSKPMLAAVGLFVAVLSWNNYYSYMMFITNKPKLQPFAWILRRTLVDPAMMSQIRNGAQSIGIPNLPPIGLQMTTVIIAMLPILCVYPFLQKYFAKGMMLGAVKE